MTSQPSDPIVDEIRAVRQKHAAQFGYDLKAIFRDIQAQQQATGREYVRHPARRAMPTAVAAAESSRG